MRRRRRALLVVVGALLSPSVAHAQAIQNIVLRNSFNPVGAGARGLGMGGAFIGVADDGTAASFNPAGLAQLRRTELSLVGFTDQLEVAQHSTGPPPIDTLSRTHHSRPDFFGLAVPFDVANRNLTVQFSYQRSVDLFGKGKASIQDVVPFRELGVDQPGTASLLADIIPEQSGAFHTASASVAYEATSRLSLGVAVNYWFANWTVEGRADFRVDTNTRPPVTLRTTTRDFRQEQDMHGVNLNAGFLVHYPRVSLGGVLRLPFAGDYNLQETGKQTVVEPGKLPLTTPVDLTANSRMRWPQSAGVGIAIRPFHGLTIATDYSRSHWSRTTIEDLPDGALLTAQPGLTAEGTSADSTTTGYLDRNFFDLLPASQSATADTYQLRAGGEYLIMFSKLVIPLRGGAFEDHSPVRELGKNEGKRIRGWTAGTGLNFNRVVFDVAFERRKSNGVVGLRLGRGQQAPSAEAATENVREDRVVASLLYRFGGSDDPLKRVLRFLFVGRQEK